MVTVVHSVTLTTNPRSISPYTVAAGQITQPGAPFIARGVNVNDTDINTPQANLAAILSVYPLCNFVRVPCYSYQDPAYFDIFVNACTVAGVVVAFANQQNFWPDGSSAGNNGGAAGVILSGTQLATESNWYAAMATYFKTNPLVWFMTANEPPIATTATLNGTTWTQGTNSVAALSTWHKATIDAIRNAGNTAMIFVDPGPINTWGTSGGMTASVYAAYHNLAWDVHAFDAMWSDSGTAVGLPGSNGVGFSANQATITSELHSVVSTLQQLGSADGTMPCVIGSYGNSTAGQTVDAGGTQNVLAVQASASIAPFTSGCAAWYFRPRTPVGNLADGNVPPVLTAYGQQVASYINGARGVAAGSSTAVAIPTQIGTSPWDAVFSNEFG